MATSQYLAFGTGVGANVLTPVSYAASALLPIGHQPGVALSEVANTTWRQTSVAAAALAQMSVDLAAVDMLDDGSVTNFKNGVIAAIQQLVLAQQFWAPGDIKGTLGAVPTGWIPADGRALSRTTYAALFSAIGTAYGSGDGSTTFNVPDLRGEFLRGWDSGRGIDPGRALGSLQDWATARPKTTAAVGVVDGGATQPLVDGNGSALGGANPSTVGFARVSKAGNPTTASDADTLGSGTQLDVINVVAGDAETRPRNIAVRWLIKT